MPSINSEIVQRVLKRAKELGASPRQLSIMSGHGPDLIRDWRRPKAPLPRIDSLQKLAEIMGVKAGWLAFGDDTENRLSGFEVPLISWVAASRYDDSGEIERADEATRILVGDAVSSRAFALRVVGDSMNRIADDGSIIVVDPTMRELLPRKYYVFANRDGATFKRFMSSPARIEPWSTNPTHEALEIDEGTHVVGRVVKVLQDV
jgi:SOS-response transcriptional repressor LexA